jgi:hypothetical protein
LLLLQHVLVRAAFLLFAVRDEHHERDVHEHQHDDHDLFHEGSFLMTGIVIQAIITQSATLLSEVVHA